MNAAWTVSAMNASWTVNCSCGYFCVASREDAIQIGASHGNARHHVLVCTELPQYAFGRHRRLTEAQKQVAIALYGIHGNVFVVLREMRLDLYYRLAVEAALDAQRSAALPRASGK